MHVRDFTNKTTVLIFAGCHLPHSSHAHQTCAYATEHCHATRRRHAHTVTPARAPDRLLLSCKRSPHVVRPAPAHKACVHR
eukprot:5813187-Pleurochrysis_carterae.AAC.1